MKFSTREMTYIGLFVALAITCAFLTRFMSSMLVPFSFLPFIAVLSGAILGKRLGAIAMAIYVVMGLVGIPVFAGDPPFGGLVYIFKPTFGFLLGFIAAAYVTGWVLEKGSSFSQYIMATLAGAIVTYIIALPYLWAIVNLYLGSPMGVLAVLKVGFFPFILLDIAKAIVASIIAHRVILRLPQFKQSKKLTLDR